jgi:uncharacterized OB-fold protein
MTVFLKPTPSEVGRAYWAYCREGQLAVQRCSECQHLRHYLTRVCPECGSTSYDWLVTSGKGTVYASTVCYFSLGEEFEAPYVVALVDLDEGPRMMTNIVDCDPESVDIGDRVSVVFKVLTDEVTIPLFRPNGEGSK